MNKGNYNDYDIAKRLGDTRETIFNTYAHWFKEKDQGIIDMMNVNNTTSSNMNKDDYISELKSLKELLDIGVINEEEFLMKKKQILGI